MSNGLDQDRDRHFVSSDLGPNCFQVWSADDKVATSMDVVKQYHLQLTTGCLLNKWSIKKR